MHRNRNKYLYAVIVLLLLLFVLPNVINFRERRYFSDEHRIREAKTIGAQAVDSVTIIPGEYYDRSSVHTWFFGQKNRDLWKTPVTIQQFRPDTAKGGLRPVKMGGSQQTISLRLKDSAGRHWVARSVNKDQQNVLPVWLRYSVLRPVFRDQAASLNPYGALVVARLSAALQLPHANPVPYWMPFDASLGDFNESMAGRLVYLEEHLDGSWKSFGGHQNVEAVLDTKELNGAHPIDTIVYLKTRLLDMLVNDWDRHVKQWRWLLVQQPTGKKLIPVAKDRDMAFYVFDEGLVSRLVLFFNPKFQSFKPSFNNIAGLMRQSASLDQQLLKGLSREQFLREASSIQQVLTEEVVAAAFTQYPPAIYEKTGRQHQHILQSRLSELEQVAAEFHRLVNAD